MVETETNHTSVAGKFPRNANHEVTGSNFAPSWVYAWM
jgi:hypothetical protein